MMDLVGRKHILDGLTEALTRADDRHAAFVLVGERGIGKTACIEAAESIARLRGHRVLDTVGCVAEARLPFAGLHRLLRPLLSAVPSLSSGPRDALMAAFGMLDGGLPDPMMVALATLQLVSGAALVLPTVITADDVHLLDTASRDVLNFLARRALDSGLVILAAASWARTPVDVSRAFRELALDRLNEHDARELLVSFAPHLDVTQTRWILDCAAGNPLAVAELSSRAPRPSAPEHPFTCAVPLTTTLRAAFADGIEALPKASQVAVLVAAIAYSDSLPEVLAAAGLMSTRRVTADVLDPAVASGMLRYDETRVTFRHPLVKTAIAQRASPSQRQAVHRALGQVITVNFARRTWHRADGALGVDDAIAAALEAHGAECLLRGEIETAILAFRRSADLSSSSAERGRRLLLSAKQAADSGRLDDAASMRATSVLEDISDLDRTRAELLSDQLGAVTMGDNTWVTHISRSADRALLAGEHGLAVDAASSAARHTLWSTLTPHSVDLVGELATRMATESNDLHAAAVVALANPSARNTSFGARISEVDPETIPDFGALYDIGVAAWACGDLSRGLDFLDVAEVQLAERDMRSPLASVVGLSADIRLDLGQWAQAERALLLGLSLPANSTTGHQRATLLVTAAKLAALRGDQARVSELIDGAQRHATMGSGTRLLAQARVAEGIASLSSGRYSEAASILGRVLDPRHPSHNCATSVGALGYLADAAVRCMRRDLAHDVIDRLRSQFDISQSPFLDTQIHYSQAVLADGDDVERLFLDGLASDRVTAPWPRARLQLAYGRWLRRHRQVNRSRPPLQAAQATFEQLGATRWVREAFDELRATSRRSGVERAGEPTVAALSSQELAIARLAASGLSNAEIARELCLSPRTVGSHLYRIFPKLDIATRGELSTRLQVADGV